MITQLTDLTDVLWCPKTWRNPNPGSILGLFEAQILKSFIIYQSHKEAREILYLATNPDFRRRGHMEALLRYWLSEKPGDEHIWLEVSEAKSGPRKLYEKLGFVPVGIRPCYYSDGTNAVLYSFS